MKHSFTILVTLLLPSLASLHSAEEQKPAMSRPLVGVIRWDGYSGSPNVTQKQEMGFLKPAKWHGRAPWFFRETTDSEHPLVFNPNYDTQTISEITDQEIEYAAAAGIDYWAFCYYAKYKGGWQLRDNFEAYHASARKHKIKASLILIGEHVGKGLSPAASAAPDAGRKDWEKLVTEIVPLLRNHSYQKVCEGRPLIYLVQPDELSKTLGDPSGKGASSEKLRSAVAYLRERSQAAGAGDPYVVGMNAGGIWSAVYVDKAGLDAVSAYRGDFGSTPEGTPYAQLWDNVRSKFVNGGSGLGSNPERQLIVPLMSGASHEPRHGLKPAQFGPNHYRDPEPGEFKAHVAAGLDWAFANPKNCPAQSVLIYAWNEHSEGGFICPTMGEPPDYKPNTRLLDELGAAIREWRPKP